MATAKKNRPPAKKTAGSAAGAKTRKTGVQAKTAPGKTPAKKAAHPVQAKPAANPATKHIAEKKKVAASAAKKPGTEKVLPSGHKVTAEKKPGALKKGPAEAASPGARLRELKKMLLTKRDAMLKEAKQEIAKYVSGENRQLVDTAIDEGDWATVDISEDISLKRLSAHRQLLLDIDECLRKINEGTYGICEECGEEISEKRLNVIPTATLCIDCKETREKMSVLAPETEL